MRCFALVFPLLQLTSCALLAVAGDSDCSRAYTDPQLELMWSHPHRPAFSARTPMGIAVDAAGSSVDLAEIDRLTTQVTRCLNDLGAYRGSVRACGMRVMVAPDWRFQECAGRQLYTCESPEFEAGCENQLCPCGCAGHVQYPGIVVVTPDLAAYKHELVHLLTRRPHGDPAFSCQ